MEFLPLPVLAKQHTISHPNFTFFICTSVQRGLSWGLPDLQNRYSDQYNWAPQVPARILSCFTSCPHFQTCPEVICHSLLPENGTKSIKTLQMVHSQLVFMILLTRFSQAAEGTHKLYDCRNLRTLMGVQTQPSFWLRREATDSRWLNKVAVSGSLP